VSALHRALPPLPRKLARLTDDLTIIPPGYGFLPLRVQDLLPGGVQHGSRQGVLEMYEPPLKSFRYVVSADIADGLGLDRTSIDVLRLGTIERPPEQVAHYLSDQVKPREAAFVMDALGHMYCDDEGYEALAAIETNNHGMSTQDTLKLHLGYRHFYLWEHLAAASAAARYSPREGWYTTQRTRPIVLDHFYEALTTYDPITGDPDLIINSASTLAELQDFQTDGALADAAAVAGAHDDCVMSLAIGHYIGWRTAGGEREPLSERRRRLRQIEARRDRLEALSGAGNSFQNMPFTVEEMAAQEGGKVDRLDPELEEAMFDVRGETYEY
jgi:hypothetical protein